MRIQVHIRSERVKKPKYNIVPLDFTDNNAVVAYWKSLLDNNLLRFRLSDVVNPNLKDVWEMMARYHKSMYFIRAEGVIVSEFTLENFTGKAAQVHFSMNPENTFRESVAIGSSAGNEILYEWRKTEMSDKGDYLTSLYGLTPVLNRSACLFAIKSGFRKIGILPAGCLFEGKVCDGMLSLKTKVKN